jgi:hypothetical protein
LERVWFSTSQYFTQPVCILTDFSLIPPPSSSSSENQRERMRERERERERDRSIGKWMEKVVGVWK